MKHLELHIFGRVQGVGFRAETKQLAVELGLTGYVENVGQNEVKVHAEGTDKDLEIFRDWCKKGPEGAEVEKLDEKWTDEFKDYLDFSIRV